MNYECIATDVVPGDPSVATKLANSLGRISGRAEESARLLRAMRDDTSGALWEGEASRAFAPHVKKLPERLQKVAKSYEAASDALRTYAAAHREAQRDGTAAAKRVNAAVDDLNRARARTEKAARDAATAASAAAAAGSTSVLPPPPTDTGEEDAREKYRRAAEDVKQALEDRKRAGKAAERKVMDAADAGRKGKRNALLKWVHRQAGKIAKIRKWAEKIGNAVVLAIVAVAVIAVVAILLVTSGVTMLVIAAVAGVLIAALSAVGLAAGLIALAADSTLLALGEDVTMTDLFWDVIGVGPTAVGKSIKWFNRRAFSWLTRGTRTKADDAARAAEDAAEKADIASRAERSAAARLARQTQRLQELTRVAGDLRWYQLWKRAVNTGQRSWAGSLLASRTQTWVRLEAALRSAEDNAKTAAEAQEFAALRHEASLVRRALVEAASLGGAADSEVVGVAVAAEKQLADRLQERYPALREGAHA